MPPYSAPPCRPSSALTSVPVEWPGRRMDDQAGGLVDDQQVVVLVDDVERDVGLGLGASGVASGTSESRWAPAPTIAFDRSGAPSDPRQAARPR